MERVGVVNSSQPRHVLLPLSHNQIPSLHSVLTCENIIHLQVKRKMFSSFLNRTNGSVEDVKLCVNINLYEYLFQLSFVTNTNFSNQDQKVSMKNWLELS